MELSMQIGKNGLTENFLSSLKNVFKNYQNVRISVLKSAGHDKEKVRGTADKILAELGEKYTARVIGFTILVKKWRKARVKN